MLPILDVALGLILLYLLLSLVCSTINEYIVSATNRRGAYLVAGIEKMLNDEQVRRRFLAHPLISTLFGEAAPLRRPSWWRRWLPGGRGAATAPVASPDGAGDVASLGRKPSYIPARTFALALLDAYREEKLPDASRAGVARLLVNKGKADDAGLPRLLSVLAQDACSGGQSLVQTKNLDPGNAESPSVPEETGRSEFEALRDSVEVWYNNAMDRVSGAYKRRTQTILFLIGLVVVFALNADTLQIARRLTREPVLRQAVAAQAEAYAARQSPDLGAPRDSTMEHVQQSFDRLHGMGLDLGWSVEEQETFGFAAVARAKAKGWSGGWALLKAIFNVPAEFLFTGTGLTKLLGLLLTASAVSLGAPFWFDMLNKVVNIRAAGRAPDERPKSPEAPPKRLAETATR